MMQPLLLLVLAVMVFAGLGLGGLMLNDRARRRHRARLARGTTGPEALRVEATKTRRRRDRSASGLTARIEGRLSQTGLRLTPVELLVQVSVGVLAIYGLAVLLLKLHPLLALPIAFVLPVGAALLVLRVARNRYRAAFTDGLPEALDVFARGLRAGRPISDSLGIVVDTSQGPVQTECTRVHAEICMGTPLAKSLARLATRLGTPEVSFFAVATAMQAESGGNLIETLESLADQLRERRKLRKKARALSSEARASAAILASLPFAVGLAIALLNFSYLEPLFTDPRGRVMALVALTSVSFGVYMMARLGKLDV
ncbi:pilus assembly protein TadB [Rhodobacterales bacterium HKCCE4037]|nr:pilus assembly protein TadB [Rhodobacterales bacterium HKCCE4037]